MQLVVALSEQLGDLFVVVGERWGYCSWRWETGEVTCSWWQGRGERDDLLAVVERGSGVLMVVGERGSEATCS